MMTRRIKNANAFVGGGEGVNGLAVLVEPTIMESDGENKIIPLMSSAWEPTPDELKRLEEGASIVVHVFGFIHPPIRVSVSDIDTESDEGVFG